MQSEKLFITRGMGYIGAWVICNLVQAGAAVAVFDSCTEDQRLNFRPFVGSHITPHVVGTTASHTLRVWLPFESLNQ